MEFYDVRVFTGSFDTSLAGLCEHILSMGKTQSDFLTWKFKFFCLRVFMCQLLVCLRSTIFALAKVIKAPCSKFIPSRIRKTFLYTENVLVLRAVL